MTGFGSFFGIVPFIAFGVRLFVGLVIAVAVYRNAASRDAREYGIPSLVWAGLVLAEPALGLFVYWFVHRASPQTA